jgi:hypothetical protein
VKRLAVIAGCLFLAACFTRDVKSTVTTATASTDAENVTVKSDATSSEHKVTGPVTEKSTEDVTVEVPVAVALRLGLFGDLVSPTTTLSGNELPVVIKKHRETARVEAPVVEDTKTGSDVDVNKAEVKQEAATSTTAKATVTTSGPDWKFYTMLGLVICVVAFFAGGGLLLVLKYKLWRP